MDQRRRINLFGAGAALMMLAIILIGMAYRYANRDAFPRPPSTTGQSVEGPAAPPASPPPR
jgi:hypothetical protein